jgi:hypothetical protein
MNSRLFLRSIAVYIVLMTLQVSCCLYDSCGCHPSKGPSQFKVSGYDIDSYSGSSKITSANFELRPEDFKISLKPVIEYLAKVSLPFNSAYACSPADPASTQIIESLIITSDHNLELSDKVVPAGTNLNSVFLISDEFDSDKAIESFLSMHPRTSAFEYTFGLSVLINKEQTHSFSIEITLDDNSKFSYTTYPVLLKP